MNKYIFDENIEEMAKKYTDLTKSDIDVIKSKAETIVNNTEEFKEFDVFIDILNVITNEAVVVFHRPPLISKSIYKESVIGKTAYRKNEPGPLRTLETGLKSVGLYAFSQEGLLIKQTSYPVLNDSRTIAVVIVEEDISDDIKASFDVSNRDKSYQVVSDFIAEVEIKDQSITDYIDDGILIFDNEGYLRYHNKSANENYLKFGYLNSINGMHYDNLALDLSTFNKLQYLFTLDTVLTKELKFDKYYFQVKFIYSKSQDGIIMIMKDITDSKKRDSEIRLEAESIQEIHHRVKNNLQTVISLLRLQARRVESEEAKKALNESVNRVLSIAATHELLSKQKEDDVQLQIVLDAVIDNLSRFYLGSKDIKIDAYIQDSIILESNKAVTVALITNELVQNSFEHGFMNQDKIDGKIFVKVVQEQDIITMIIEDNGVGYDVSNEDIHNLGLYIVDSFVKNKLSGKIDIESSNKGTKTIITFKN